MAEFLVIYPNFHFMYLLSGSLQDISKEPIFQIKRRRKRKTPRKISKEEQRDHKCRTMLCCFCLIPNIELKAISQMGHKIDGKLFYIYKILIKCLSVTFLFAYAYGCIKSLQFLFAINIVLLLLSLGLG